MSLYSFVSGFSFDICCVFLCYLLFPKRKVIKGSLPHSPVEACVIKGNKDSFLREIPSLPLGLLGKQNTMWSIPEPMMIKKRSKSRKDRSMGPLFAIDYAQRDWGHLLPFIQNFHILGTMASSPLSSVLGLWFFTILAGARLSMMHIV